MGASRQQALTVVDRVLLLLAPKYEWTAEEKASQTRTVKKARLALAELLSNGKEIAETGADGDDGDNDDGADGSGGKDGPALSEVAQTLLQRLLDRLVDSVQVHVRDVHVRYEDAFSQPERPFTFGLTLAFLHAQSVEPAEHDSDAAYYQLDSADGTTNANAPRPICKLLQLNGLSVYWNDLEPTPRGRTGKRRRSRNRSTGRASTVRSTGSTGTSTGRGFRDSPRHLRRAQFLPVATSQLGGPSCC